MVAFALSVVVTVLLGAAIVGYMRIRPVGTRVTWGEAMFGAMIVFFGMFWLYGVVPHQWLAWADNELNWRTDKIFVGPGGILRELQAQGGHMPFTITYAVVRDVIACAIYGVAIAAHVGMWFMWQNRGKKAEAAKAVELLELRPTAAEGGLRGVTTTDANPPMPEFRDDYVLQEVDAVWLAQNVKPKQFIHIDQSECIMCEGCVDICPWKCIFMVTPEAVDEAVGTEQPGVDPADKVIFTIDDDVCTRCALCVDRCPTGVIILGKVSDPLPGGDPHQRTNSHGYGYGMRLA